MSSASGTSVGRYVTNASSSVATRVLQLTVLVWVNQYLLKRIDAQEYSLFPVVMSLVFFADIFRNIFTGGLGRYLVEADARGEPVQVTRIVSSMIPLLGSISLILAATGCIAAWQIAAIINVDQAYVTDARIMLLLLLALLCINVLAAPFSQGLYVKQRFVVINVIDLGCEVLRIAILLTLLLGVSTRVVWVVAASVCAGLVNIVIRVTITRRMMPEARWQPGMFSSMTARKLTSFGAWTSIQGITDLVSIAAPALILNRFATAVDVAAYHLGRLPDLQIRRVTAAAAMPAQPAMTSIYARSGEGSLNALYYRGGRYHLWLTLFVVAPLLVFGPEIFVLYAGSEYASAATVVFALLVIYPFVWASAMFYRVAHAIGRVRAYYICDVLVQAITLGALLYSVRVLGFGAAGAAVAVAISMGTLHLALIWPLGLRLVRGNWSSFIRLTLVPGLMPFLGAFGVCHLIGVYVEVNSWLRVGTVSGVGAVVYGLVLFGCCLDSEEKELVRKLKRKLGRIPSKSQAAVD